MYSSRGNNAYGQQQQSKPQPYSAQSSYAQNPGAEGSRHSALLGSHPSAGAHYGSQYTSVYGSTAQVPATSTKGAGSSVLEGRSGYGSAMQDSPKYASDYPAASQKYGQKGESMFSDDRLPYAERASAYSGRDLQNDPTVRFADSIAFGQHKTDIYDRLDAAAALRQELLQSDGSSRQADYLAARSATVRSGQELLPYGGRFDTDLHALSMISGTQHAPSILGAAPRREVEDLMYARGSANPGYGVSLPPGRAYVSGKSLHGTSLESDYPGGILARAGYSRLDDRKDDIHYDRIGKDGLFSHKEITVLYIPDLSDCLPSIDAWRDQWLAHKKAVAERERLHALEKEKSREKKEISKDKEPEKKKDVDKGEKTEKKKEAGSASKLNGKEKVGTKVKAKEAGKEGDKTVTEKKDADKTVTEKKDGDKTVTDKKDGDKTVTEKKDGDKTVSEKKDGDKNVSEKKDGDKTVSEKTDGDTTVVEKKDEVVTVDEGSISGKKNQTGNSSGVKTPGSGKKKIIRKVIKKKVVSEKDGNAPKQNDDTNTEVIGEDAESSGTPVTAKASTKKKAIKKTPVVQTVKKEDEAEEPEHSEDKTKSEDVVGESEKPIVKKKIIKKVTKKKVAAKVSNDKDKVVKENESASTIGEPAVSEVKLENNESVSEAVSGSNEIGNKSENTQPKEEKEAKVEVISNKNEKPKEEKKAKVEGDGKEKKDKDVKTETRGKEVKDKKKVEEPPRHPGLILQTKGTKNSKLRSLSLSLDSLLDYTDKDIEESTFELSVFAEMFYEMLQFQMGSRILTFLQKLRIKFVAKMNKKKRQREEVSDKKEKEKASSAKKSSPKRQKTDDATVERPVKTETSHESNLVDDKTTKDENMVIDDNADNMKVEDEPANDEEPEEEPEEVLEEELEEDPEEDPEEDENMADAGIEASVVVVNWSREDLNIPFNTPVSFEHDFLQEETPSEHESASTKTLTNNDVKLESGTTRWNAKLLLMSGLSHNAWEELSSERKYDDRIPHLCNMLRFAFLKEGNSSMAIGGSWDPIDGNDPLVDKSALVQTVLRYAKQLTGLDLKNCRKWNPFLEENAEVDKVEMDVKSEKVDEKVKSEQEENVKTTVNPEKKDNQKVEDLRLILHSLGNCMSHRDVKELVQSALLESNTGRDDRVLYSKLVKMTDI
ncbi:hypothetical protein M8C21_004587 [Ambrosia artemisiifolia]|uniref:DBC1/CARP1 catalytically inactive NUDIX hydrolase domain-containing protein n=1 Tax=Ambrosia artemisiifolia TaxID=4212 RepID=A0AAD5BK61_AMBAR|nr:hypothetical protein M8C21_004587 [Ambrosia artemisiifolia]